MKLTLLGTGSPVPDPQRRGPSQVIEIGDDLILVDCGSGALHRLVEAGLAAVVLGRAGGCRSVGSHSLTCTPITSLACLICCGRVGSCPCGRSHRG